MKQPETAGVVGPDFIRLRPSIGPRTVAMFWVQIESLRCKAARDVDLAAPPRAMTRSCTASRTV
jgi:hypothetical protein